ncbi:MAG: helix-turn-helix transcriptional regulator [Chloroflexi bacterium]|nr:helix-turn-helix transcriptional regulator [Chloroflexota bacterium]
MPVPDMGFANAVRQLREQRRLTKAALAARCGLAPSYLSRLESGDYKSPTVATLVTLAQGLEVDPRELLVLAGYVPDDIASTRRRFAEETIASVAESAIRSISRTVNSTLNPDQDDTDDEQLHVDRALLAERLRTRRRSARHTTRQVARKAGVRVSVITDLEAGREPSRSVDLAHVLAGGYGLATSEVDDLLFEVGLSQFLADDIVLSTESRRMTLEFARLARIRDRHSRQGAGLAE